MLHNAVKKRCNKSDHALISRSTASRAKSVALVIAPELTAPVTTGPAMIVPAPLATAHKAIVHKVIVPAPLATVHKATVHRATVHAPMKAAAKALATAMAKPSAIAPPVMGQHRAAKPVLKVAAMIGQAKPALRKTLVPKPLVTRASAESLLA